MHKDYCLYYISPIFRRESHIAHIAVIWVKVFIKSNTFNILDPLISYKDDIFFHLLAGRQYYDVTLNLYK